MLPKLIAVVGPTASGKTGFAIKVAKRHNGEIISADSRQVYRGMDIGTAKIKSRLSVKGYRIASGVPHHLIDLVLPDKTFTVADFKRLALKAIRGVIARGHLPILVGGTGLYVRAVVYNLGIPNVPPNPVLRRRLERLTTDTLFKRLRALDRDGAARIDRNNRRRLIRALEIVTRTGTPLAVEQKYGPPLFEALVLGVAVPRSRLYRRIDRRVHAQMRGGLLREVQRLVKRYGSVRAAFTGIGYRELIAHIHGQLTLREAVQRIMYDTHAYARRQMTWFRRDLRIVWVRSAREAQRHVSAFLKNRGGHTCP